MMMMMPAEDGQSGLAPWLDTLAASSPESIDELKQGLLLQEQRPAAARADAMQSWLQASCRSWLCTLLASPIISIFMPWHSLLGI